MSHFETEPPAAPPAPQPQHDYLLTLFDPANIDLLRAETAMIWKNLNTREDLMLGKLPADLLQYLRMAIEQREYYSMIMLLFVGLLEDHECQRVASVHTDYRRFNVWYQRLRHEYGKYLGGNGARGPAVGIDDPPLYPHVSHLIAWWQLRYYQHFDPFGMCADLPPPPHPIPRYRGRIGLVAPSPPPLPAPRRF